MQNLLTVSLLQNILPELNTDAIFPDFYLRTLHYAAFAMQTLVVLVSACGSGDLDGQFRNSCPGGRRPLAV